MTNEPFCRNINPQYLTLTTFDEITRFQYSAVQVKLQQEITWIQADHKDVIFDPDQSDEGCRLPTNQDVFNLVPTSSANNPKAKV